MASLLISTLIAWIVAFRTTIVLASEVGVGTLTLAHHRRFVNLSWLSWHRHLADIHWVFSRHLALGIVRLSLWILRLSHWLVYTWVACPSVISWGHASGLNGVGIVVVVVLVLLLGHGLFSVDLRRRQRGGRHFAHIQRVQQITSKVFLAFIVFLVIISQDRREATKTELHSNQVEFIGNVGWWHWRRLLLREGLSRSHWRQSYRVRRNRLRSIYDRGGLAAPALILDRYFGLLDSWFRGRR